MTDRRTITKRGKVLLVLMVIAGVTFTLRAAQLQIWDHSKFRNYADSQQKSSIPLKSKRGAIYDRNGKAIAYDVEAKSYTITPRHISNKKKAASKLAKLTGKSRSYWLKQFKKHPRFLYVERTVTPKKEKRYEKSGLETLRERIESKRIYPFDKLADEVIGFTDTDNRGVSGLEKQYDYLLAGVDGNSMYLRDAQGKEITTMERTIVEPVNGSDLYLSLDVDLQQIVEKELQRQLDSSGSIYGSAIFLDVNTGGVIACATVEKYRKDKPRCRPISDQNEPGSTAKIIPLATVFADGIFEPDDKMCVENGEFRVGKYNIRDDHDYDTLRCDEVGIYSSNIGVTKMGIAAGPERIYKTLIQLGVGTKTGIDFPGEAAGWISKPDKWNDHTLGTICFGYGISLTNLQIAAAYGSFATDGELLKPYFAEKSITYNGHEDVINRKTIVRYVFDEETIDIMRDILSEVVRVGTARKAMNRTVPIVGKTGTAKKTKKEGKGYDPKRYRASFAGYFPADNPQVVGVVMFDEPESSIYGGEVAAPALREIAVRYASLPKNKTMVEGNSDYYEERAYFASSNLNDSKIVPAVINIPIDPDTEFREAEITDVLPNYKGWTIRDVIRSAKLNNLEYEIKGSGVIESQFPKPGTNINKITKLVLIGNNK